MDVRYPIGRLEVPATVTRRHIDSWLEEIAQYIQNLRKNSSKFEPRRFAGDLSRGKLYGTTTCPSYCRLTDEYVSAVKIGLD